MSIAYGDFAMMRVAKLLLMTAGLSACVAAPPGADQARGSSSGATPALVPPLAKPAPALAPLPQMADFSLTGRAVQGGVMRGRLPAGVSAIKLQGQAIEAAPDGRFLIAFDRDAAAEMALIAQMVDGRTQALSLAVAPGDWRIERVNTSRRGAARTSAEFQRRRPAELAQIAEARAQVVESDGWRQTFIWPVSGRFSGFFGSQRVYQGVPGSYHGGTDIAVPRGTAFVAPADGVVVLAAQSPFTLEGHLLIVAHGMGLNSAFLHCDRLDVQVGDVVRQGDILGTVGATGRATGPHMHWGMKWGDARIDPGQIANPMMR